VVASCCWRTHVQCTIESVVAVHLRPAGANPTDAEVRHGADTAVVTEAVDRLEQTQVVLAAMSRSAWIAVIAFTTITLAIQPGAATLLPGAQGRAVGRTHGLVFNNCAIIVLQAFFARKTAAGASAGVRRTVWDATTG